MNIASRPKLLMGFLRDPGTVIGCIIVSVALLAATFGPLLPLNDPTELDLDQRLAPPSKQFLLGTDHLGRDQLSRVVYGTRTTLGLSIIAVTIMMGIALVVGSLSGYYGGWVDTLLMGVVDILLAFPSLILAIAVAGILGPSLINVLIAISLIGWAGHARVVRAMVLAEKQKEYIEAARSIGANDMRIMFLHIAHNILGPFMILATLDIGWTILGISGLNFLGLGVQPPTPEWGAMLNDARPYLQTEPQLLIYPSMAIFLVVLGFNLLGDGLRDALDPRQYRF